MTSEKSGTKNCLAAGVCRRRRAGRTVPVLVPVLVVLLSVVVPVLLVVPAVVLVVSVPVPTPDQPVVPRREIETNRRVYRPGGRASRWCPKAVTNGSLTGH